MKLLSRLLQRRKPVNTGVLSIQRNGKLLVTNNTVPDDEEPVISINEDLFKDWLAEHKN